MTTRTHDVCFRVSGELGMATTGQLLDSISNMDLDGQQQVTLDLSELSFCDAQGLSTLLTADRVMTQEGRHLSIRGASGPTRRLLAVTGVDQFLDVS
ncbi:MAG: STAS domain-containing protein [Nocardioidaceae bacterium]